IDVGRSTRTQRRSEGLFVTVGRALLDLDLDVGVVGFEVGNDLLEGGARRLVRLRKAPVGQRHTLIGAPAGTAGRQRRSQQRGGAHADGQGLARGTPHRVLLRSLCMVRVVTVTTVGSTTARTSCYR